MKRYWLLVALLVFSVALFFGINQRDNVPANPLNGWDMEHELQMDSERERDRWG